MRGNSQTIKDSFDDITQEILIDMYSAACYYKRFLHLENSFEIAKRYTSGSTLIKINQLETDWKNRKHHGARKSKFGLEEENELETIIKENVPESEAPKIKKIDVSKFKNYASQCMWNRERNLGKRITKMASINKNMVSLSGDDGKRLEI